MCDKSHVLISLGFDVVHAGLLSAAVAATTQANPAAAQAPALPPMTNRAPAMRQAGWVQREGELLHWGGLADRSVQA